MQGHTKQTQNICGLLLQTGLDKLKNESENERNELLNKIRMLQKELDDLHSRGANDVDDLRKELIRLK